MDKKDHCILWGILSGVGIAVAGTALVVASGGTALLVAGVGLGASISGEVNVVQQACNDKKEFDGTGFITNVGIGAATGIISAGAGGAASSLTSKFALEGGKKIATTVACQSVGGVVSSTGGTITQKYVNKEDLKMSDIGTSILTGALSGGVGSAIGGASS